MPQLLHVCTPSVSVQKILGTWIVPSLGVRNFLYCCRKASRDYSRTRPMSFPGSSPQRPPTTSIPAPKLASQL